MSVPTLALRPPVAMPPKRQRASVANQCTSCDHPLTETGECRGCSE